jgi:hypothetical protein
MLILCSGLRHRLGLTMLPPNAPAVQCCCGAALCHTNFYHAIRCSTLASQLTLRHDILKGILRLAVHWAGMASALESPPPPPSWPSHRRRHFRRQIPHPSRGPWQRPPRHAPRHRHRRRFRHPPHLPQHPFPRCCHSRGSGLTSGQAEANSLC